MHQLSSPAWQQRLTTGDSTLHIHLLGIGGSGLAPIATVLHERGFQVSGSDMAMNTRATTLAESGVRVYPQQVAENLTAAGAPQPDVVLISSAVGPDNPERMAAEALGIPVVRRRDFLRPFLAGRQVIAVAGTHGKSTTTAMIVKLFHENGVDAGYIVGSDLPRFGNAHAGQSQYFVIEADEYDYMFWGLVPYLAAVTNVEWDHPDCYPTPASFQDAFARFVKAVPADGEIISCADDDGAVALAQAYSGEAAWLTYGLDEAAMVRALDAQPSPTGGYAATVIKEGETLGQLQLSVPGLHNLRNALAALAVAQRCGLDLQTAITSLNSYQGVARRFEFKGDENGVTVIDDYAHHPTEVRATLSAARARFGPRRIWAILQPHTFSRTRELLPEMANSLDDADRVIITDIYAARERDDGSLTAADLVAASRHPQIEHVAGLESIADVLADCTQPGDVVITLGAGTSHRIGEMLLDKLKQS